MLGPLWTEPYEAVATGLLGPLTSEGFDGLPAGQTGPIVSESFDALTAGQTGPIDSILFDTSGNGLGALYYDVLEMRVEGIKGKQIATGAFGVATPNLVDGVLAASAAGRLKTATGYFDEPTFTDKVSALAIEAAKLKLAGQTYDFSTAAALRAGTPVAGADVTNKTYVDAAVNGLTWQASVDTMYYVGTRTVAQINALTPLAGWSTVAGSAGTPTAGASDALTVGDLAEFDGTSWKKIVANVGGFPPNGARAVVAWPTAANIFSPLVDGTDEGKLAQWAGASLTPTLTTPIDGWAVLCRGALTNPPTAFNENKQFAFTGTVPSGSWNQVGGPIPYSTTAQSAGAANSGGASSDLSRGDHVHDTPAPTVSDKARAPTATTGVNFQTTGLTISGTPGLGSNIEVLVNGVKVVLGSGSRLNHGSFTNNVECYFSTDGGATALAINAVTAGATLYWNAVNAGYDLAVTDSVDLNYETF